MPGLLFQIDDPLKHPGAGEIPAVLFKVNGPGKVADNGGPGQTMAGLSANALQLAEWLEQQPEVERVWFPWLASHPHHQLARQQMALPGGMISVVVKGDEGYAERIISKLRWFTLAESLGGVESLVSQPFSMTHASIPLAKRLANGITPQLIRLSVGIEDPHDLIADWQQALRRE